MENLIQQLPAAAAGAAGIGWLFSPFNPNKSS